jgi:hypothetical protein
VKRALLLAALALCAWLGADAGATPTAAATPAAPDTAIVVQDRIALRAAPRESAQLQALLWQGDTLEVRGRQLDYLQVYDHRRERGGYVRAADLRLLALQPAQAPALLAVVNFLRDTPGAESLGIAYAAAYLKAAPAQEIGADLFDALGTLAERLARRASSVRGRAAEEAVAAHLDVIGRYGVVLTSFEHNGRMRLCYDGDAFRRVLALPASAEQKARAALALTRPDCVDPALTPRVRHELDAWRVEVLERAPDAELPDYLRNRLRLRRAAVWSAVAFQRARRGEPTQDAGERALQALAGVDPKHLAEADAAAYTEAAIRVGASRWAAEPLPPAGTTGLGIALSAGEPGQTCIELIDRGSATPAKGASAKATTLLRKCTYATVWPGSARVNATGSALALAVQPLDAWRELWLFRRDADGWHVDILPPGEDGPELGYVEFAGWVPGQPKLLAAREVRNAGAFERRFELVDLATLAVEKRAEEPSHLSVFYRWQDATWKRQTVSLR